MATKISLIGGGNIGGTIALLAAIKNLGNVVLVDIAKGNIKSFLQEIKRTIKMSDTLETDKLIHILNSKIIGWGNYFNSAIASRVFSKVDNRIYHLLISWAYRRHSNKGQRWIAHKYFTTYKLDNWRFHANAVDKNGTSKPVYLKRATETKIRRYIKILGDSNPFKSEFQEYFEYFHLPILFCFAFNSLFFKLL